MTVIKPDHIEVTRRSYTPDETSLSTYDDSVENGPYQQADLPEVIYPLESDSDDEDPVGPPK